MYAQPTPDPLVFGPWEVSPARDLAGRYIGSRPLVMNWSDLRRILALDLDFRWTVGNSGRRPVPVVMHPLHGKTMVARLIVGAHAGQEVGYRDGDPFNVTRGNLVVTDMLRRHRRTTPVPVLPELGVADTAGMVGMDGPGAHSAPGIG